LTRFLHANRFPLRSKTLWRTINAMTVLQKFNDAVIPRDGIGAREG
jgi:hypothetical protein